MSYSVTREVHSLGLAYRPGRLEAAHTGAFIDEVGDLSPRRRCDSCASCRPRLSHAGEQGTTALGRVIAATWHDLDADVARGTFEDPCIG
jgi:transcriptional regulator with GAF, ATPase, and Fis domain